MTATATTADRQCDGAGCCDGPERRTAANLRMLGLLLVGGGALLQVVPAVGPLCPLR